MRSVNRYQRTSENKSNKAPKLINLFLDKSITFDLVVVTIMVATYFLSKFVFGEIFSVAKSDIEDILNELVSTTLSLGGFVLAALAIIASIQVNVPKKESNEVKSGKELFYNSDGYKNIIRIYSLACIVNLFTFLLFTAVRSLSKQLPYDALVGLVLTGLILLSVSFIRCVYILWMVIRIR